MAFIVGSGPNVSRVFYKDLVKALVPGSLTGYPLHFPSNRRIAISFAHSSRFFIALAAACFGKNTGTLTCPAKSS